MTDWLRPCLPEYVGEMLQMIVLVQMRCGGVRDVVLDHSSDALLVSRIGRAMMCSCGACYPALG